MTMTSTELAKLGSEFYSGTKEKDDFALAVQDMALLSAAPTSISILGHLCLIATGNDFSLIEEKSVSKFDRLKYPESFRASLCQVSNEGYWAFLEADKQMDSIRMLTEQIPVALKRSLQILFKSSVKEVSRYLPIELKRIQQISETCKTSSQEVVNQFKGVMKTMDEMQEATLKKQGKVAEARDLAEVNLKQEEIEIKHYKKQVEDDRRNSERVQKELTERNEEYKKAYDEIPGVNEIIKLGMLDTFTKCAPMLAMAGSAGVVLKSASTLETLILAGAANGVSDVASLNNKITDVMKNQQEGNSFQAERTPVTPAENDLYRYANDLSSSISAGLCAILKETDGEPMNFKLACGENEDGHSVKDLKNLVKSKLGKIEEKKATEQNQTPQFQNLVRKIEKYFDDMKQLLDEVEKVDSKDASNKDVIFGLVEKHSSLIDNINILETEKAARTGTNTINRPGPGMLDKIMKVGEGGSSMSQTALKNAHLKVECSKEQMKECEERLEQAEQRARDSNKTYFEIENRLRNLNLQTKELPQLLRVIEDGLKTMGELKKEWDKLLRFFTNIANIIETATGPAMQSFNDWAKETKEFRIEDGESFAPTDMIKQQIYEITKEAGKQAFVVNRISGCYSSISKQHLMPLVAQLNSMIALNKEKDAEKIQIKKDELKAASKHSRQEIEKLTQENIISAREALHSRMTELEKLADTYIPALPHHEMVVIKQDAKMMTEGKVTEDPDVPAEKVNEEVPNNPDVTDVTDGYD